MSTIEKFISPLVQSQFPDFFKDQGPLFILFVEEYYKWLESNDSNFSSYSDSIAEGNPLYHARRLLEYKDVDFTLDEFVVYLKEKYLKDVPISTNISNRRLIKAAHDLFAAKGSQRSFDLFFKMVFGTKVEIYVPGEDVLRPSDGTWVLPKYLELTRSDRTLSYVGKMVNGQISGATAFVEYLITRNINGKLIDIVYLSNLTGNFETGEIVTDDSIVADAPKIIGSLTTVDITTTGELFEVGEIVRITSARGVEGFARVSEVQSISGIVRFTIIDGGWGYSTTAETTVAERTLALSNITNSNSEITEFFRFETVSQNLFNFSLTNVTGNISNNVVIINNDTGANTSVSVSVTISQNTETLFSSNTANVILNQISANVFSNTVVYEKNRSIIVTNTSVAFAENDSLIQRTGTSNNVIGKVSSVSNVVIITANTTSIGSNGIHTGTYIEQSTSNANGYIYAVTREQLTTPTTVNNFSVVLANGTFNNTDVITIYEDNTKATSLGTFYPVGVQNGYQYLLSNTNLVSNTRWSYNNTAVKVTDPTVNSTIIIATDIGGIITGNTDVSANGILIGSNSSAIGLKDVNNTFYSSGITKIYGEGSNTFANSERTYTGSGADFSIGVVEDTETVRLSPDLINSNNDGPGSSSVKFSEMLISGANSTFGNLSSVYIELSGTGYDNTDIVVFTGGNTGVGSFEAGNASIVTDASGNIVSVALSANTGNGIVTTPTVSVTNSTGGSTSGSGASLVPVSSLGFIKQPGGDITFTLLDLLRFNTKTIGSIVTLSNINPGENYNVSPFVFVYEAEVAAYNKKDIILNLANVSSPGFILGETVEQTIGSPGIELISNNFTGGYRSVASVTVDNAGSGFTVRPTVTFDNTGTNGYNAEANTTAKVVTAALGDDKGTGYRVGDTLTVSGGTYTSPATVNVTAVGTISTQSETDFVVFEGGIDYNTSDTITLDDGSVITVDAVVSNIVTEFTVTSNSTSGIATNDSTLTQSSTSGSGSGFSITLGTDNQAAFDVAVLSGGSYTALPTLDENIPTGGLGSNATLDLSIGLNTVYIVNGGVNYLTAPNVSIGGTGGSGANATASLTELTTFTASEILYSTDGIANVATGEIFSSSFDVGTNTLTTVITSNTGTWQNSITVSVLTVDNNTSFTNGDTVTQGTASGNLVNSNTSTLIVKDVTGTFQANATVVTGSLGGSANISTVDSSAKIYTAIGTISRANSEIIDTDTFTASSLARGNVKAISSNTQIILERRSLFTDFLPTTGLIGTLVGKTSGTTANVTGTAIDETSFAAGDNANVLASVVASEGGLQSIEIINSGYGFEQDEGVDITSQDGVRAATGKANILNQGIGLGFYSSNKGFLDDSIKLHDGEYYQNYSYEIQTSIPFDRYASVLKDVIHVAGKRVFGKLSTSPQANINITVTSTGITTS